MKAAFIKDNLFIAFVDNLAKSDFEQLTNLPVIMTEKDAVKCDYLSDNFWYLKVEASISENLEEKIIEKLKS